MKSLALAGVCLLAACAQPVPGPVQEGRWATMSADSLTMRVGEDVTTLARRLRLREIWREAEDGLSFSTVSEGHRIVVELQGTHSNESRLVLRIRRLDGRTADPAVLSCWESVVSEGIKP